MLRRLRMFQHEGSDRSHRQNQLAAGYLAFVAGYVNSAGLLLIGSFTSHVTGNIGRLADDLAVGRFPAALLAFLMAASFFAGALVASMPLESSGPENRPRIYGLLLLLEALLLAAFAGLTLVVNTDSPRMHDLQAMLLCFAMGLQNSLVTRLSGAIVRTTHLTGVVTDLAIESARWFRHWRHRIGVRTGVRLVAGHTEVVAPQRPRAILLLSIIVGFSTGGIAGALLAVDLGRLALLLPMSLILLAAISALARNSVIGQLMARAAGRTPA